MWRHVEGSEGAIYVFQMVGSGYTLKVKVK
jgi:hypothetical protein